MKKFSFFGKGLHLRYNEKVLFIWIMNSMDEKKFSFIILKNTQPLFKDFKGWKFVKKKIFFSKLSQTVFLKLNIQQNKNIHLKFIN